ncbi:EcoRII N-terminal effector-binding domain-containing protein [Tropicimonas sp. TH_r6]|uniref:EcoRII N-terminal effector-binding domain-containing protein n=1 Tax=Tropicimonas sp. TH_r6 TaxID=3082085 RepID=UPI002954302C|nr:EcoRII N-terminal effector-binding domain-containing protein [Tropicimonas sp. TH_r6]MDV7141767.1 EcoRII N-terminal effector-binding domain-containing protein [Tropicimonas sp. TH_r6]
MTKRTYRKTLSANDAGETKSHQAGMLIPKADHELRAFLGELDPATKNPRRTIFCFDEHGEKIELQFIYYNNKLHDKNGTRNEFRLTCLTGYLRQSGAKSGDELELSKDEGQDFFKLRLIASSHSEEDTDEMPNRIVLRGWRRIH